MIRINGKLTSEVKGKSKEINNVAVRKEKSKSLPLRRWSVELRWNTKEVEEGCGYYIVSFGNLRSRSHRTVSEFQRSKMDI